jgi:rifampicin phosphotransferase
MPGLAEERGAESEWVVRLDGHGVDDEVVGGKASTIDRLIAAGFTVPPSAAVTTAAYRRFIEQESVRRLIDGLPDVADLDDVDAEADRVADAFADQPVPDEVAEAVAAVADSIAGCSGTPSTLAARSSATVEDAAAASYAGQFTTELDREPGEDLLDAIRRVWGSAWAPSVRSYRAAVGEEGDLAMGVLLMDMVDADHAGVVFTRDPQHENCLRIETVEGQGEQLVSGAVTPDFIRLPRSNPQAGLDESAPRFLAELADTALAIERELGGDAQDIEWAHDGERLWIVQSRPITVTSEDGAPHDDRDDGTDGATNGDSPDATVGDEAPDDGFDTPLAGHVHTPAGIGEMLPGVLPPLVWTITAPLLEEAFRSLFAALGALPVDELDDGHRFVGRFRGRAALDLDLMRAAARLMPGQSQAELERQYFGEVVSPDLGNDGDDGDSAEKNSGGRLRGLGPLLRAARFRRAQRTEAAIVNDATERLVDERLDPASLTPLELLRTHEAILDLAARALAAEAAVAAMAAATYRLLERYLERVAPDDGGSLAQRLTTGAIPVCKATALDVCHLVDLAQANPALAQALCAGGDDLRDRLHEVEGGEAFLDAFQATIESAGSAQVYAGARWSRRTDDALATVQQALHRAGDGAPDPATRLEQLEQRLTSTWQWRAGRAFTGQVVDVRIRLLRRAVHDTSELLRLREETKRSVLRIGGETRRIVEHVAGLLVDRGDIREIDDIELLTNDEFITVLEGGRVPEHDELDRRREALERMREMDELPARFGGDQPEPSSSEHTGAGNVLRGWGAGPGTYTGRPVVVTDRGSAQLDEGDVLVARSTDPSWTSLFATAGAIVVEEGGPLSHAAIVARELGVPAVLNVTGATHRLADVARVTVDGSSGTVEIHDADDDADGAASETKAPAS